MAMTWRKLLEWLLPARRVQYVQGVTLPAAMPRRALVVVEDDGEQLTAGMRCPCGCNSIIELLLIREIRPSWELSIDLRGRPSLSPSIWRQVGCRAHFWLRDGKVIWCEAA